MLNEYWESVVMPGTIDDFVNFLGVESQEKLESMNFMELEKLQGVTDNHLINCGGNYSIGLEQFYWKWKIVKKSKDLKAGEEFDGRGKTYDEAALNGLLAYWQLLTYRKG